MSFSRKRLRDENSPKSSFKFHHQLISPTINNDGNKTHIHLLPNFLLIDINFLLRKIKQFYANQINNNSQIIYENEFEAQLQSIQNYLRLENRKIIISLNINTINYTHSIMQIIINFINNHFVYITKLSFNNLNLTSLDEKASNDLFIALAKNSALTTLSINNTEVTQKQKNQLFTALNQYAASFNELNLITIKLQKKEEKLEDLFQPSMIAILSTLQKFTFSHSEIQLTKFTQLINCLKNSSSLLHLDLTALQIENISDATLIDLFITNPIKDLLKTNTSLLSLNLNHMTCKITSPSSEHTIIKFPPPKQATAFFNALASNTQIELTRLGITISFEKPVINNKTIESLTNLLAIAKKLTEIEIFIISNKLLPNDIKTISLFEKLKENTSLTSLALRFNQSISLSNEEINSIETLVKKNKSLIHFIFSPLHGYLENKPNAIFNALKCNRSLRTFYMQGHYISPAEINNLLSMLKKNKTLFNFKFAQFPGDHKEIDNLLNQNRQRQQTLDKNWSAISFAVSFFRANQQHTFRNSYIPLTKEILRLRDNQLDQEPRMKV